MIRTEVIDNKMTLQLEGDLETIFDDLGKLNSTVMVEIAKKSDIPLEDLVETLFAIISDNVAMRLLEDLLQ